MTRFDELRRLPLAEWHPRAQVAVPVTEVRRPLVPAIDIHNHLGRWLSDGEWMIPDVAELLATMDECGVETIVNLDGLWGDEVTANVERYDNAHRPVSHLLSAGLGAARRTGRRRPAHGVTR